MVASTLSLGVTSQTSVMNKATQKPPGHSVLGDYYQLIERGRKLFALFPDF